MNDNVSQKLEQFEEEIFAKVASIKKMADDEVEEFQVGELEKCQDVALEDSYGMIQSEVAKLEKDIHKIGAEKITKYRTFLFKRREQYRQEVFEKVRERLAIFSAVNPDTGSQSAEYKRFILQSAKKLGASASETNETILFIRKEDLLLEQEIKQAFAKPCKVQESDEIRLGGLSAENRVKGYQEDKSLESRLDEQFQWFCDNSKMTIQL